MANAIGGSSEKGDTIVIDMPMTVDAVIIYLAIILAGCIVVSIADSFAAKEIATRLKISKAKGIFTQVCALTNLINSLTHIFSPCIYPVPCQISLIAFSGLHT